MKKQSLFRSIPAVAALGLVVAFGLVPAAASAASNPTQQLNLIKSRAATEIDRRLDRLHQLSSTISGASRLSASDTSTLSTEVSTQANGLTSLKAQIQSDTDLDSARIDAQSIFSEYHVYALIVPKVWMVRVADDQQAVETKLNILSGKLQTRVNQAHDKGKDVGAMQNQLNDMIAQTQAAQKISSVVEQQVLPLQPTDYSNDHTILSGYRDQLKAAHANNKAALADAKAIVQGIKGS
jgi:hypothetical protein